MDITQEQLETARSAIARRIHWRRDPEELDSIISSAIAKALRKYDPARGELMPFIKEAGWKTTLNMLVTQQGYSRKLKRRTEPLETAINVEIVPGVYTVDMIPDKGDDPSVTAESTDADRDLMQRLYEAELTAMERRVMWLWLHGTKSPEIMELLTLNYKSVDNTIARSKRKLAKANAARLAGEVLPQLPDSAFRQCSQCGVSRPSAEYHYGDCTKGRCKACLSVVRRKNYLRNRQTEIEHAKAHKRKRKEGKQNVSNRNGSNPTDNAKAHLNG